VRDRGEERRIGLDQQPLRRQRLRRFLQVLRVPEGDDSRDGDEETEIERLAGEIGAGGEAMDDAGERPLPHLLGQDPRRILFRVAGMDDQRQPGLPRGADMGAEAGALPLAIAMIVIIIEAALADRHDARVPRLLDQGFGLDVGMGVGVVRVDAD
jgi:hypothetical protein